MGISSSNRRRNNNYLHRPPPSHQFVPSSYLYSSERPSLPPPPPSNPLRTTQPPNYTYQSNPPQAPPPPTPQNFYLNHPLPPPPPPNYSSYYYSHGYNSCNYANPMIGQSSYRPYYANQGSGWSAIRQVVLPVQPIIPAPYVEHQNAKKVRNDVNVHKDTLRIMVDELNPDQHLVSFEFDALFDGSITLYYFGKEETECKFVPLYPEAYTPLKIPFKKGFGQKFHQPSGTGMDLGFFELTDLASPSPSEDVFPLVISAEACAPSDHSDGDQSNDHVQVSSSNAQITLAVLEKNNGDPFKVKVVKQLLWVDGVRYELREIFGISGSISEDFDDGGEGKECVICMTEPKDTAILPCRHMCMCNECAKELRLQSDKCPICRQPIEELLEIKISHDDNQ